MKITQIGRFLVNLDKIIYIDSKSQKIHMDGNHGLDLTTDELEEFISLYNMYDTDETKLLLERVARVVTSNPEYLSKEGIQEQITIKVKYHNLENELKELTEGKKLKELPITKLMVVYREIQNILKEKDKGSPF